MIKRLALILFLLVIFYLSSTSGILVTDPTTWFNSQYIDPNSKIVDLVNKGSVFYNNYTYDGKTIWELDTEFYIRKLFHIFFYSLLSLTILWNLTGVKWKFLHSAFFSLSVATLDEMNQYLTLGRSGRLLDILVDASGILLTLTIASVVHLLRRNRKRKQLIDT